MRDPGGRRLPLPLPLPLLLPPPCPCIDPPRLGALYRSTSTDTPSLYDSCSGTKHSSSMIKINSCSLGPTSMGPVPAPLLLVGPPGEEALDKLVILEQIGQGGHGVVHKGGLLWRRLTVLLYSCY